VDVAEVVGGVQENATAGTIRLRADGLTGHLAGQHIDIRLTADDGYTTIRSYSVDLIRAHEVSNNASPFRLLYSLKSPDTSLCRDELRRLDQESAKLMVDYVHTRSTPAGWPVTPARLTSDTLLGKIFPAEENPDVFVCGQTVFVETVADWLVMGGYSPESIRTERFGGTGGIP
jgi:ferredoxin-NADP reductase